MLNQVDNLLLQYFIILDRSYEGSQRQAALPFVSFVRHYIQFKFTSNFTNVCYQFTLVIYCQDSHANIKFDILLFCL